MEKSRIKRAKFNMIWLLVYEVVLFASNLVLPKLIISTFGSEYNGIIGSITQFLSFVSILRLGVAGATRVSLYKSLAAGDRRETSSIIRATEIYMRKIGLIILAYIMALVVLYPLLLNSAYGFLNVALLVFAIGIGTFAQYFYGITYKTLLQADQRLYIANIIQTVTVILNTVISCVLINLGQSIQIVKLVTAVLFVLNPIVLNKLVIKMYGIDRSAPPDNSALSRRWDVMGHSIANIVHENTDVLVLTLFCDIKVVSVYSVYHFVVSGLQRVLNIFTTGAEPVFGSMFAKEESDKVKKNLGNFEYVIGAFISVIFSATILIILPFVTLYTKGVKDIEYVLPMYALVITLAYAFFCLRSPYVSVVQAAGHYKETKKGAYAEAAINLISSVILVNFIGIVGTAVGTLLANVFRTVQYALYVSRRLVKRSPLVYVKLVLWIGFNIAASYLLFNGFVSEYAAQGWGQWALSGLAIVAGSGVICLLTSLALYRESFRSVLDIALRMLKLRK